MKIIRHSLLPVGVSRSIDWVPEAAELQLVRLNVVEYPEILGLPRGKNLCQA